DENNKNDEMVASPSLAEKLSGLNEDLNYLPDYKVGKVGMPLKLEFEPIVSHEFDCAIKDMWKWFFSEDAKYPIKEYLTENPKNRDVVSSKWENWYTHNGRSWQKRDVQLITKLDDLPAFVALSGTVATESRVERSERACQASDNAFVWHRMTQAKDVPFGDTYTMHEKWEWRQKCVFVAANQPLKLTTICKVLFACEWHKSSFFKGQIKTRSLKGCKDDIEKYVVVIDTKIQDFVKEAKRCAAEAKVSPKKDKDKDKDKDKKKAQVHISGKTKKKDKDKKAKVKKKKSKKSCKEKRANKDMEPSTIPIVTGANTMMSASGIVATKDDLFKVGDERGLISEHEYDVVLKWGKRDSKCKCRFLFSLDKHTSWIYVLVLLVIVLVFLYVLQHVRDKALCQFIQNIENKTHPLTQFWDFYQCQAKLS
ncbi:hypothetical protein RFI_30322, partial [Reticulomyxa filosa]